MRLVLIADAFPPMRTSGAVQLRDLSRALVRNGHELTVILPSIDPKHPVQLETIDGAEILRLKTFRMKDISYLRRVINEALMPFLMLRHLRRSGHSERRWDGIVWYSPSIFHAPLIDYIRRKSGCRSYLILRDIFPEWAADMGIMSRGLPYRILRCVARYQYSVADVIGVQTPGNLRYFGGEPTLNHLNVEVLQNWLGPLADKACSICMPKTPLIGRRIFVYAGNMGVAQRLDIFLDIAEKLQARRDIGFLFVGRGSEARRLAQETRDRNLDNVFFHDEIDPDEIPSLYAQCAVGLIALDPRHSTHNIPGKFLTYMQCGLPVLANLNPDNDLADIIRHNEVGRVAENGSVEDLARMVIDLAEDRDPKKLRETRCRDLFSRLFSVDSAARQIVRALDES